MPLWQKLKMWMAGALGVMIVLAASALAALAVSESRRVALADAGIAAEKLALVVEQNIARTFESYALSINGTVRALESGALQNLDPALQRLVLFDEAAQANGLGSILVIDATGKLLFDSRNKTPREGDFSDREYFTAQQKADAGLYMTAPFVSRLDQAWTVGLSRRVNHPDGSFAGVVVGAIKLEPFRKLFASLSSDNSSSTMSLFRTDGIALVRTPHVEEEIGRNYANVGVFKQLLISPHGTFDQVAVRDGVTRRYVYGRVGSLPLVFSIGLAFDDVLLQWRQRAEIFGGLGLAIAMMMAGLAVLLRRELARRQTAEREALAAASRFEQLASNSNDAIVLHDALGKRSYASPKFYEFLGRTPDDVGDSPLRSYLHPNSRALPSLTIERLLKGEQQVSETLQCIRPDGASVWLESVSRLMPHPDGLCFEILTNIRDVTSHKLHTDEMQSRKEELEVLAHVDGLTGIANRRAFDRRYAVELQRAAASERPISALMVDVDHFKAFNDHFGHAAGDEALKAVAACLDGIARRPPDLAARYGGEEFVLLLPATDLSGARRIAERLRLAIADLQIAHPAGGFLTVSVGVATSFPAKSTVDLIKLADGALYAAKAAGRNRIETATPQIAA